MFVAFSGVSQPLISKMSLKIDVSICIVPLGTFICFETDVAERAVTLLHAMNLQDCCYRTEGRDLDTSREGNRTCGFKKSH